MPASVTPSRRCSGSVASLSSCAARLAACSSVGDMTGSGAATSGSCCSGTASSLASAWSVTGGSSATSTCAGQCDDTR
eukprot:scaffold62462_cov32-Phaeocystis_antarctica.AAC.2